MKNPRQTAIAYFMGISLSVLTLVPASQSLRAASQEANLQSNQKDKSRTLAGSVSNINPKPNKGPQVVVDSYQPDELLVKFKRAVNKLQMTQIGQSYGATTLKAFQRPRGLRSAPIDQWRLVKLPHGTDLKRAKASFANDANVDRVEFNHKLTSQLVPDDPSFSNQWGLNNTGQTGGTPDIDIDAPEAWDIETGTVNPIVAAIVDTGIDYNHPDLAANIWVNPGEVAGDLIDNDGNGYVDDVNGYDFVNNDSDPFDDNGHGTHVAGTVGAVGNNTLGVAGVNWGARLMALKVLDATGSGSDSDAINAILYAVDMGVRIMNASWGSTAYSQALADAISTAASADALFVAAAGNGGTDNIGDNNDAIPFYPASYSLANILSVASIDDSGARSVFSNYGPNNVDLGAPGESILSTYPGGDVYAYSSGTSMAAPHVTGAASLLLAQNPARTTSELADYIMATVVSQISMAGTTVSGGSLNIGNAVSCNPTAMKLQLNLPADGFTVYTSEPTLISGRVLACTSVPDAAVTVSFNSGDGDVALYDDGAHGDGSAADGIYANYWTPENSGPVTATATATHNTLTTAVQMRSGQVRQRVNYFRETIPYQWIDASTGTAYLLTDDSSVTVPIGFDFDFYGLTQSDITISSNGYVTFGSSGVEYLNTPLPSPLLPDNLIAPFWDDLNPAAGGMVYSLLEGTAPDRHLTIAWVDVPHLSSADPVSFEVTLYEGSGDIVFQYLDTNMSNPTLDFGASATVGIEDSDGIRANLYTFEQPVVPSLSAFRFYISGPLPQLTYHVTIDTSSLVLEGALVMDFINGDGLNNHYTNIYKFFTEGALAGAPVLSGAATGTLIPGPANMGDSEFVAEIRQPIMHGASLSFDLKITTNGPFAGFPDSYSFYLLDENDLSYPTDDPLGTDALFAIDIDSNHPTVWVFQSDFTSATVELISGPPVADPGGPYSADVGVPIVFDGSGSSDPDSDPLTYSWDFGDGNTGIGATPSHSYISIGTYSVTLTVNDGSSDSDPVATIARVPSNQVPVADAGGPYAAHRNQIIVFDGSATTDADGDTLVYSWDFGDGTSGTGVNPTHSYTASGNYPVTLIVTDGFDNSDPANASVIITNVAPVANPGGPYSIPVDIPLVLNGGGSSDPDGDSLTYQWDFGDGTSGTGETPTHTYTASNTYTVTLTVDDGELESLAATTSVAVGPPNQQPVSDPGGPYSGNKNQAITFDGSASTDANGDALTYHWDFGDGVTAFSTSSVIDHVYNSAGIFDVVLVVNDGYEDSLPVATTASVANHAPFADPGGPYVAYVDQVIAFDGSASYDSDGDSLTYRWDFGDGTSSVSEQGFEDGVVPYGWVNSTPGWNTTDIVVNQGAYSLKADVITNSQSATIEYTDTFIDGSVRFDRKVSSETNYDFFQFYIDGVVQAEWSGELDWQTAVFPLSAGQHTLRWTYAKDSIVSVGQDTAWIDNVSLPKGTSANHAYTTPGDYTVSLIVNDGEVDSDPATVTASITILDTDGDGVADNMDNCTLVANTPQRDTDADGYGNMCDPDFDNNLFINAADLAYMKLNFFSSDANADLNGDGFVNAADLSILKTMFFGPPGPSGVAP